MIVESRHCLDSRESKLQETRASKMQGFSERPCHEDAEQRRSQTEQPRGAGGVAGSGLVDSRLSCGFDSRLSRQLRLSTIKAASTLDSPAASTLDYQGSVDSRLSRQRRLSTVKAVSTLDSPLLNCVNGLRQRPSRRCRLGLCPADRVRS